MGEQAWRMATDPARMLEELRPTASKRKLRLFAVACCRRVLHLMTNEACRKAVEVSERYADGRAWYFQFDWARLRAQYAMVLAADQAAWWSSHTFGISSLAFGHTPKSIVAEAAGAAALAGGWTIERRVQVSLLHCIFGNPFRPVTLDPVYRTPTVLTLARAAYEERSLPTGELDVVRLALLADAFLDAGCTDQAILDHLRAPGPHVRGCFAVDEALGNK